MEARFLPKYFAAWYETVRTIFSYPCPRCLTLSHRVPLSHRVTLSRHVTLSHSVSCSDTFCHVVSYSFTLYLTLPRCISVCHVVSHSFTLYLTLPHCISLCRVVSNSVTLYLTLPHCISLCHVISHCHVVSHSVTLYLTLSRRFTLCQDFATLLPLMRWFSGRFSSPLTSFSSSASKSPEPEELPTDLPRSLFTERETQCFQKFISTLLFRTCVSCTWVQERWNSKNTCDNNLQEL